MRTQFHYRRSLAIGSVMAMAMSLLAPYSAYAVNSSWNPTLLVNTESFQTIDEGSGTSNIEIRFGQTLNEKLYYDRTNSRFVFSKGLLINGNTKVIGNLSGSTLNIDGASIFTGTVTNNSTTTLNGITTANANVKVRANLSGSTLNVDGTSTFTGGVTTNSTVQNNGAVTNASTTALNGVTTATANVKVRANLSGSTLNVDGTSTFTGGVTTNSTVQNNGAVTNASTTALNGVTTATANVKVRANLSGSTLNVDGTAAVVGDITTKANLGINADNDSNNAVLTFGNATAAQTLTFSNANQRFEFSKNLKVNGSISGSTLVIDGNTTFKNITYSFPNAQGAANTYLKNDGSGNLSWATTAVGNSTGSSLSLHPQFPNAAYFQSGSTAVGTLGVSYDTTNRDNYYHWVTSQGSIQDYWTAIRVKIPKNFANWSASTPIVLRYRTLTTSTAQNNVNIKLIDTAGANVAVTGGATLASGVANTWTTATLGNLSGGTYTADGFITILIKQAATSAGAVDIGYINLNLATTVP